jgi:hypothetical protein
MNAGRPELHDRPRHRELSGSGNEPNAESGAIREELGVVLLVSENAVGFRTGFYCDKANCDWVKAQVDSVAPGLNPMYWVHWYECDSSPTPGCTVPDRESPTYSAEIAALKPSNALSYAEMWQYAASDGNTSGPSGCWVGTPGADNHGYIKTSSVSNVECRVPVSGDYARFTAVVDIDSMRKNSTCSGIPIYPGLPERVRHWDIPKTDYQLHLYSIVRMAQPTPDDLTAAASAMGEEVEDIIRYRDLFALDAAYLDEDDNVIVNADAPRISVRNPGFETGLTSWVTDGSVSAVDAAFTGSKAAKMGSQTPVGHNTVSQTFVVPDGTDAGSLTFMYNLTCDDNLNADSFSATLTDETTGDVIPFVGPKCDRAKGWLLATVPLHHLVGHVVTLRFELNDYEGATVLVDDVTINSGS